MHTHVLKVKHTIHIDGRTGKQTDRQRSKIENMYINESNDEELLWKCIHVKNTHTHIFT